MRKLGEKPLTGAEKQKRHRERVKARPSEAAALKARVDAAPGEIPGLKSFYEGLLREFGASAEEAQDLALSAASFQEDVVALLRKRGQAALDALRAQRSRRGSSLLSRLAAMRETAKG